MTMFGSLMFISYQLMSFLPNIHLVAILTAVLCTVYRKWSLIAVLVYVFLSGLYGGFGAWWLPYLYLWPALWGALMLIPKGLHPKYSVPVSAVICTLHGFLFGTLYAPAQALLFGLNFSQMLAWIAAGLYFDVMHGIGNAVLSLLIYPLSKLLIKLEKSSSNL